MYLTLLSLHTITVLPLTTVYFVSEVYCTCTLNALHSSKVFDITYKCEENSLITLKYN